MKKKFVARNHEEYGYLGLIEVTAPEEFEPMQGMGTAHDCLEHFAGDDGSIDHEFLALGCTMWIRGIGGYWDHLDRDWANNIASDLSGMLWRLFYYDGYEMKDPLDNKKHDHDDLDRVITQTRCDILADFEMNDEEFNHEIMEKFLASAYYWIHKGYMRAKKKYPKPEEVCHVFKEIEHKVNEVLKYAEEYQEFVISYKLSTCEVYVEKIYQEYEDY